MLLLNDGTGHFVEQIIPTRFEEAYSSVILDINGDGHSDIFVSNSASGSTFFGDKKNEILLGDGEGNFARPEHHRLHDRRSRQLTKARVGEVQGRGWVFGQRPLRFRILRGQQKGGAMSAA